MYQLKIRHITFYLTISNENTELIELMNIINSEPISQLDILENKIEAQ